MNTQLLIINNNSIRTYTQYIIRLRFSPTHFCFTLSLSFIPENWNSMVNKVAVGRSLIACASKCQTRKDISLSMIYNLCTFFLYVFNINIGRR